ncbi:MAG: phage holin family protein [Bacteroidales bacterium]|jgi:hypothetical protein|nr:phage holin family protein [Bacteroidales bacterium]
MTNDPKSPGLTELVLDLMEQLKSYVNMRVDYVKLQVADYMIRFFSSLTLFIILFWIVFFAVFFGSFAFAYWFGEKTGMWSVGFLIVAGFYILLAVLVYVFRRVLIIRPFTRLILEQLELNKFIEKENGKEERVP